MKGKARLELHLKLYSDYTNTHTWKWHIDCKKES